VLQSMTSERFVESANDRTLDSRESCWLRFVEKMVFLKSLAVYRGRSQSCVHGGAH
jgi:hypothetical protein